MTNVPYNEIRGGYTDGGFLAGTTVFAYSELQNRESGYNTTWRSPEKGLTRTALAMNGLNCDIRHAMLGDLFGIPASLVSRPADEGSQIQRPGALCTKPW
jgi:hypothetical protein